MTDTNAQITQLQQQQALFTAALAALLQGNTTEGAQSTLAYLYALDPTLEGTLELDPPVSQSQLEASELPPKA